MNRLMKTFRLLPFALSWVLVSPGALAQSLPLRTIEFRQSDTPFNLQSQRGVPISSTNGIPPGSDGRMSTTNESYGSLNIPTTGQFSSLVPFGGLPGLTRSDWQAVSNSVILQPGTNAFSDVVAQQMRLPVALSNGTVVMILRRAQIAAPYLSRQVSYLFGAIVSVPATDEHGLSLTNTVGEAYWLAEPYSTNRHENAPYYWSPHSRKVYAIQPGPIEITWRRAAGSTIEPPDYSTNAASYYVDGGNYYQLYTVRYVVSGSPVKTTRKMYWTEKEFTRLGKPVAVPAARVGAVNIVYNNNFPRRVEHEYSAPGQVPIVETNMLEETRTLWYDQALGYIYAYNQEGRVFVELLGDARPDGQSRESLGFELVDVFKQVNPADVTTELGERLTPPLPGSVDDLFPEPILQPNAPSFVYQYNVAGSDRVEFYATRETQNLNDCLLHWLEAGVAGLRWPALLGRYRLAWPTDVTKYSQYIRPRVATENEAKETAVALATENVPIIEYQDPLDRPRANLTEDFNFYTFLQPPYTAHRTLLRSASGDSLAFERVFSWLDVNLATADFANNSVVTNLSAWDPTNGTFTWSSVLLSPRVVAEAVEVGQRLIAPSGEPGASSDYLAGHIHQAAGTSFNVHAYQDPFTNGFDLANQGAIIPINAIPSANELEVWWFRQNAANSGLNAGNTARGFKTIYWPSVIGRYTIQWPAHPREIVLASLKGSGTLAPNEATGTIYYQNERAQPGYNPNEEHAIMSGGTAYATRDDLNVTNSANYSSHPFVLVEYTAADGRPQMSVFKVLREKPEAGYVFDYIVEAGRLLQPPPPLMFLAKPVEGTGDTATNYNREPGYQGGDWPGAWLPARDAAGMYSNYTQFTYRDRKHDTWVYRGQHAGLPPLQVGTYDRDTGTFRALSNATAVVGQPFSFHLHVSRQSEYLDLKVSDPPNWLSVHGFSLAGTPTNTGTRTVELSVSDIADDSSVTCQLTIEVVVSGSVVTQGPLQLVCTNRYTDTVTIFSNRPPFLAVSPNPSNSFTMHYYYKTEPSFAWPEGASPPPGSIVPYLRPFRNGAFVGDGNSKTAEGLDIVYRPVWPERDPMDARNPVATMQFGYTLTTPKHGLPGVRDWLTARVLYQQSIAANVTNARPSVVLHDATREKYASITNYGLEQLPAGVRNDYYQGKYYFPNLPPHLATRLFFDPNRGGKGSLVLKGEYREELLGDSYILLNVLRGSDLADAKALCPDGDNDKSKWDTAIEALTTDVETFYENPAQPGTYIPNSDWTVSVGVTNLAEIKSDNTAVDSYALSATGPGSGYVTLLESSGTAFTEPGDPVAMHIIRVTGSLYSGELKVIAAANPLSELVTFQHTADLAGRSADYEYEWKIAPPVDGSPPEKDDEMTRYQSLASGPDLPRYLLGGAGIRALGDNYVVMRYKPTDVNHPLCDQWSKWTTPQLAEGWIKRVLAGINPFNQRITDLFNNRVNTDVSILTQAGHRWEGDVALNLDTINDYGLIEIYETVLRRGRMLSIESGYNYGPANDALLLAAGYLNDLYMMIGNEAWADAANPTIGIGTAGHTYSDIATALFAFKGQVPSLLEEELALLRGRDDFLQPGVVVSPVYNRLVWNYTRGIDAGEVIYALNYNVQENPDQEPDGVIDAADALRMFPQGHGDAYGHFLTALMEYYSLLMDTDFDWVPRIEAVLVLGTPVSVDYLDERKFAAAAAAVARAGRQVFDLTWRRDYQPVHSSGWEHFSATRVNSQRAYVAQGTNANPVRYWGMDHWACRTGQGAYLNWVVGNAIVPELDPNPNHEGIQKVDRATVPELQELVSLAAGLQTALDNAESGLSPLGLPEGGLAFDINPAVVAGTDNGTHFEQIYQRAKVALNNAVAAFDDAKDVTRLMRSEQDSLADFRARVAEQEHAYQNNLIELYGTPYPDDIGPGKTWKQGYDGPDLIHFSYTDTPELDFPGLLEPAQPVTFQLDIQAYAGTGNYPKIDFDDRFAFVIKALNNNPLYLENTHYISFTLDPHGFFQKPTTWTSRRASPGKLQEAIGRVMLARNAALKALSDNVSAKYKLDRMIELFESKLANDELNHGWDKEVADIQTAIETAKFGLEMYEEGKKGAQEAIEKGLEAAKEGIPDDTIAGLAAGGDLMSAAKSAIITAAIVKAGISAATDFAKKFAAGAFTLGKEGYVRINQVYTIDPAGRELENLDKIFELDMALGEIQDTLFTINQRLDELDSALRNYRSLVAEGDRIQQEREILRQRSAAVVQGYRTRDAAFRIFRNEKLERYKTLFDLAARYALLAANAYDYETGLLNTPAGRSFVARVINSRALGVLRNGEPQYAGSNTGDPGLSSALAEMKADWDVLRSRLGFNNPDAYGTTLSLRTEHFRILPGTNGNDNWGQVLQQARVRDLLEDADVRRYCMQISRGSGLPVPGLLLTFSTTITDGYNLFGRELAAGDHAFSPSSFATKIFGVGVALQDYRGMDDPAANSGAVGGAGGTSPPDPNLWYLDPLALAATPYIYLIPVGVDAMRSPPLGDTSDIRTWIVDDVAIPMPFNIGASDFSTLHLWQSADSLTEPLFAIRKHQAFRPVASTAFFSQSLYGGSGTLQRSQYTNNRLVGRSVWNTRWKLVIPGHTLLSDPDEGIERFIQTVTDIRLHFVTYSYSGN